MGKLFDGRIWCIGGLVIAAVLAVLSVPPLAQDTAYHMFADDRGAAGIPNVCNVLSNAAFLLAGLAGLMRVRQSETVWLWRFFFSMVLLVAVGSGYYHWRPDNATLVWDRLPMTMAFAGLLAAVVGERINLKVGKLLFLPLLAFGAASVGYWHLSEAMGAGDLRLYILVQFLPLVLVPLIVALYQGKDGARRYWGLAGCYVVAKLCEVGDQVLFRTLYMQLSGHTLKHLVAAAGLVLFVLLNKD